MQKNCSHKKQALAYSELNDEYIRLKYELKIHRCKTRLIYQKFSDLYIKYWKMYDFINAQFAKSNSTNRYEDSEKCDRTDSSLPY